MMLITEMGLPDYYVNKIISDYRKLVKLSEAIPEGDPFRSLLNFMEDIIPAFKNTLVDGEIIDEYYWLRELAMSNADDACVIPVLLRETPLQENGYNAELVDTGTVE